MTVTERLMKPGRFQVDLRDTDAAHAAYANVALFDHIVVTANRLQPIEMFSDANILAQAIYTGAVTGKPTPTSIVGEGPSIWLGTEDGRGDLLDAAVTNTAASLTTWVNSLRPSSLSAGSVTNTTTLTATYQWTTRREALDAACRAMGAEWRVNPDFTLDAGPASSLFVSTPTAIIARNAEGPEGGFQGIEAVRAVRATDVNGYTTKVIVVGKAGDGAEVATGTATGSNVYKDGLNNNVVMERFVNAPTEPAATISSYATSVLNLFGSSRKAIALSSRSFAATTKVRPGDTVYVYDKRSGLVDDGNQEQWRGETITPIALRCKAITWPLQAKMGVYGRRSGATPVYVDLSDWVQWEPDSETVWEVGTSQFDADQDPQQLGAAYLGVNPQIVDRVTRAPLITATETITASNGSWTALTVNPDEYTLQWDYAIDSAGWCKGVMTATCGASWAGGTGRYAWQHPITAVAARGSNICGHARITDSGTGVSHTGVALIDTAGLITVRFAKSPNATTTIGTDTLYGPTEPMTWVANDRIEIFFEFPLA